MNVVRLGLYVFLLVAALALGAYFFALVSSAQTKSEREFKPDVTGAQKLRTRTNLAPRQDGYTPQSNQGALNTRPRPQADEAGEAESAARRPARVIRNDPAATGTETNTIATPLPTRIRAGTPLSRVLHTSQLSLTSAAGSDEQYVDRDYDLRADERTTFDTSGGSFDIAVGRSGARYEVFSATSGNRRLGALVVSLDTNGDYVRDSSATYDLGLDFGLPSAIAVVSGTSRAGREFVIVSSSGFYGGAGNPANEPTAGVVLLVRDPATGGFDTSRSRSLVAVGNNQLNNANALALL
ncbi:MAG TPA: hypothetical protein VGO96_14210, partial [Pyrinomonadaceae bacterium]|nr:hypothetical protein [Pyrinomonadaceae bacterium]